MPLLNRLPVELIEIISSFLEAADIAYLWFTGDSFLCLALRQGGVSSFRITNPFSFPRFINQLRLKTLHVSLGDEVYRLQQTMPDFECALIAKHRRIGFEVSNRFSQDSRRRNPRNSVFQILLP